MQEPTPDQPTALEAIGDIELQLDELTKVPPTAEIAPGSFWSTPQPHITPKSGQQQKFLLEKVRVYAPLFWQKFEEFITSQDKDLQKVAFQEYNKLQLRTMPQDVSLSAGANTAIGVIMLPAKGAPQTASNQNSSPLSATPIIDLEVEDAKIDKDHTPPSREDIAKMLEEKQAQVARTFNMNPNPDV